MKRALGHHDGKRRIFFFRGAVMGGLTAIGVVKPERQNAAIEGRDRPDEIHNPDVLRMLHLVERNPGGASEPRKQGGDRQHIIHPGIIGKLFVSAASMRVDTCDKGDTAYLSMRL